MTLPSVRTWYLRTPYRTARPSACHRLSAMRVRAFELRLIGVALVVCWSIAAGLPARRPARSPRRATRPGTDRDRPGRCDLAAGRTRRRRLPGHRLARDP